MGLDNTFNLILLMSNCCLCTKFICLEVSIALVITRVFIFLDEKCDIISQKKMHRSGVSSRKNVGEATNANASLSNTIRLN